MRVQRLAERPVQGRQCAQGGAQLRQIPRPRRPQRHPGEYPLQVADRAQRLRQPFVAGRLDERCDGVITQAQRPVVAQGTMQPAPQQAASHGGGRAIEHARQREFRPPGEALVELQIAARGGIHDERRVALLGGDGQQMGQRGLLGLAHIGEQRPRRRNRRRLVGAAEAPQIVGAELLGERAGGRFSIELPGRTPAPGPIRPGLLIGAPGGAQGGLAAFGRQNFRRPQALELRIEGGRGAELHHAEPAAGQIEPGETEAPLSRAHAREHVVAPLIEEGLVRNGAGRDDAHHLAFHRSLGFPGFAALLADGDGLTLAHQFRQVGVERDDGHAGHGNRSAGGRAALGERDVEQLRGAARVLVEHLVEVAHAVEQQHVRVLRLDAQVLLHHRGVF